MVRTPSIDRRGMRKGTWTLEEDMKLIAYVTRYGCWNWSLLPKFAGLARCGKSCRLRWLNYLRPDLKRGNFTQEEEDVILRLHTKLGNRWSLIASNLPGRTDNEIKNHWHTALKKRFQEQKAATKTEKARPSKSKDQNESMPEMESIQNNGALPSISQNSDCTTTSEFSSINSDSSTPSSSNENSVLMEDDDFAFLDAYSVQTAIENFRTELFVPEIRPDHVQSPDSVEIPDATSAIMSSQPSMEDDSTFFDYHIETMIENFWSEPYMADMSHIPSELYEYSSMVNDADLWSQSTSLFDEHIRLL